MCRSVPSSVNSWRQLCPAKDAPPDDDDDDDNFRCQHSPLWEFSTVWSQQPPGTLILSCICFLQQQDRSLVMFLSHVEHGHPGVLYMTHGVGSKSIWFVSAFPSIWATSQNNERCCDFKHIHTCVCQSSYRRFFSSAVETILYTGYLNLESGQKSFCIHLSVTWPWEKSRDAAMCCMWWRTCSGCKWTHTADAVMTYL